METHTVRIGYCEFEEILELESDTPLVCMECGAKFTAEVDEHDYCPECGSNDIELAEE